jgi:hypothetical protein
MSMPKGFTKDDLYFLRQTLAYELGQPNTMTDAEWDKYAYDNEDRLKKLIDTFEPYTGQWIFGVERRWFCNSGYSYRKQFDYSF